MTLYKIAKSYNLSRTVLLRLLVEKGIVREKIQIVAKDNHFCYDSDGVKFHEKKVSELMDYLGLIKVPAYQIMCNKCLILKDAFCYQIGVGTCVACLKRNYKPKKIIPNQSERQCSKCLELKNISEFYSKAYKCKQCAREYGKKRYLSIKNKTLQ